MSMSKVPWWGWLIGVVILLNVLDGRMSIVPLVIVGFVLYSWLGRRGRLPWQGSSRPTSLPPAEQSSADRPMPTIDVPRYPGGSPPPPPPGGQATSGQEPAVPGPTGQAQPGEDPAVSLGRLHLSRAGRDLQNAVRDGTATEVSRTLEEITDLVTRMQGMLDVTAASAGRSTRDFAAGLRRVDELVQEARDEHPPGAKVTRLIQACLRMGHTGRHE